MAVKLIEQGLRAVEDSTGSQFSEHYRVDALAGSDRQKMAAALAAVGIPAIGDPHPDDADVVLVEKRATQDGLNAAIVECTFALPESEDDHPGLDAGGLYRFSSSLTGDTVNTDRTGTLMSVTWSGNMTDVFPNATPAAVVHNEIVEAELFRPQYTFEISRRLTGPNRITDPRADAANNVGLVNSALWGTYAARTVLCVGVDLEEISPTETRVRYLFEFKRATWDVRHAVRIMGVVPKNATDANGIGVFEVYDSVDFNSAFLVSITPP